MFVLEACSTPNPEECDCCDHAYDAGRFGATLHLARDMRMPWDWNLQESLESPITQPWLRDHFLPTQESILQTGSPRWQNYPIRQAALALAVIQNAPWSTPGRKGAAWALTRAGMTYHHWQLNPQSRDAWHFEEPDESFWDQHDDLRLLAEMLDRAYLYVPRNGSGGNADVAH